MAFAKASRALGLCDRCGLTYKLSDLREQVENRVRTGLLVCAECLDKDHPQYWVHEAETGDPYPLQNPRPDTGVEDSRTLSGDPFPAGTTLFGQS